MEGATSAIVTALTNLTTSIGTEGLSAIAAIVPAAATFIAGVAVVNFGLGFVRRVTRG